ncbi:hypothetical protein FDI40_gp636 [Agrobacterium phage Atu_ph07]|uniref:Uncharacterized protein n=1 Tax=Agrobacterium phage Atu_ph07 TaxID=2024264 RepID=A0A2L0V0U6_9CAUD|nr:hypothetical protein FDI40_gp636 [Agrobacterium phage Atu_ph07]AUZ95395.1 hypothetical protein [Agrobacterium phage Atu_ph07]
MSIELGTLKAVKRYVELLESKNAKPVNNTVIENGDPTCLNHLLWMCKELEKKIVPYTGTGFSVDKFSRWVGFIQGILIAKGLTTVQAERDITRPWFNPVETD